MSDIKVFVKWESPTFFAGEDVKCIITFKNVAAASSRSRSPSPNAPTRPVEIGRDQWKLDMSGQQALTNKTRSFAYGNQRPLKPRTRGHYSTLSLSAPVASTSTDIASHRNADVIVLQPAHKHKRSVSIISIGTSPNSDDERRLGERTWPANQTRQTHMRAASLQDIPSRNDVLRGTEASLAGSGPLNGVKPRSPTSSLASRGALIMNKKAWSNVQSSIGLLPLLNSQSKGPPNSQRGSIASNGRSIANAGQSFISEGQHEIIPGDGSGRPSTWITSPASNTGTPRSSTDFYSQSSNSTETLASEYITPPIGRQEHFHGHRRHLSHLSPASQEAHKSETLMMGYVQLLGSFVLDGSLVNLTPFESVKRKAVIGGQGSGGVVGIESSKRETGLFGLGPFGWSNIGQSIGGLLGSQELSSIQEMKGKANSRSIPIISTPQSILFVDLSLGPGESKSFSYRHTLPQGIPPSHRGRAIKSTYHLAIGTQRPRSSTQQNSVQHIEVPFKVLPGIDDNGDVHGHDLLKPHIILKDTAHSQSLGSNTPLNNIREKPKALGPPVDTDHGLHSYATNLLTSTYQGSGLGLISPTSPIQPHSLDPMNMKVNKRRKDLVESKTLQAPTSKAWNRGVNSFQIQRGGCRVAIILLARSTFRLGEAVSGIVDFRNADIPCYALHTSLETSEIVDPMIALRSNASVHRATRRVHWQKSENTVCARRSAFTFMIPVTATAGFITSGISLEWNMIFEFVTSRDIKDHMDPASLFEEMLEDARGSVLSGTQEMPCESFEIKVPLKVYGTVEKVMDTAPETGIPI